MHYSEITDPVFRKAVEAIDTGDLTGLKQLLQQHPQLVYQRLDIPKEGYFRHPYLLWFIADNPIRNEKLPTNIVEIARGIIGALQIDPRDDYPYQLGYTLGLVATGRIPKECGVQIELIDLLIEAGAETGSVLGALAHNNNEAAAHLISKGSKLSLAAAVGLKRVNDIKDLIKTASADDMQLALVVAAFFGNAEIISFLIDSGVDVNAPPTDFDGFHSHAGALHQAVYSGSLRCVQLLVNAGAALDAKDRIYHGTALDWAEYMQTGDVYNKQEKDQFAAIASFLRSTVKLIDG